MKYITQTWIVLTLLLTVHLDALGQQQGALTLTECREMALKSSRNLKISNEQIGISEDLLASYKTNRLPNFSINGNYLYSSSVTSLSIPGGYLPTYTSDPSGQLTPNIVGTSADGSPIFGSYAYMPDINLEVELASMFNANAQITQPIYMGRKIETSIKLARLGVGVSELSRIKTEAEVILQADKAFYSYLKVSEQLLVAQKYAEVVEEFLRQMSNAQREGMRTRNDQLKVEVQLNEAKLQLRRAENGVRLSRMNLCYVIGLPMYTEQLAVVDQFDEQLVLTDRSLDISKRPEYAMLQKQVEAKGLEVQISKSEFLPSVSALASYGYTQGASLNNTPLIASDGFAGGVKVSVPIFHWGEGRRKVSSSRREVEIARQQFEELSQQMTLELMQAINNYDEASYEVVLVEHSLVQAEENMRQSENRYHAGVETLGDYLESQTLWQKAMSDRVEANATQRIAYTYYLKTAGEQLQ